MIKDGYTPVADNFLEHYSSLGITTSEAMFIVHLISYKWDKKHPYPSFGALAKRMGVTDTAVRNYARSLEKKELLRRLMREGETNLFDLSPLFVKLELIKKRATEVKATTSRRYTSKAEEATSSVSPQALWDALSDDERKVIQDGVVESLAPMLRRKWDKGGAKPFVHEECLLRVQQMQQLSPKQVTTPEVSLQAENR